MADELLQPPNCGRSVAVVQIRDDFPNRALKRAVELIQQNGGRPDRARLGKQNARLGSQRPLRGAPLQFLPGTNVSALPLQRLQQHADDLLPAVAVQFQPRDGLGLLDGQHDIVGCFVAELEEVKRVTEPAAQARRTALEEFSNNA
jgi:hypothetical protein